MLLNGRDLPQAQHCYRRAIRHGQHQALIDLADAYAEQGDHEQAATCYRQATEAGYTDEPRSHGTLLPLAG